MGSVRVELGDRGYEVIVGRGALERIGETVRDVVGGSGGRGSGRAFVVIDNGLPGRVVESAVDSLEGAGFAVHGAAVHAEERDKSLGTFERLLGEIAGTRHERTDPVIALGGGIAGDVAGFVAASYRRGVPFVQCPTTLLSMVDASVGGKTGVNLETKTGLKKNLVGAFWQPRVVVADLATLDSLSDRVFRCGLAECIKHGMIADGVGGGEAGLFAWMEAHADQIASRDADVLGELVERNVRVKAAVVAADEREEAASSAGGRALLNLGHTFGHAIEPISDLTPDGDDAHAPLQHGEAVALGLVAACGAAEAMGWMTGEESGRVRALVERVGLPARVADLPSDATLIEVMRHDKKVVRGTFRLVVPDGLGRCGVVDGPGEEVVAAGWSAVRV